MINKPERPPGSSVEQPVETPKQSEGPVAVVPPKKTWPIEPRDEWERGLLAAVRDCGVSLPDSAFLAEELYD